MASLAEDAARVESLSALPRFRGGFHACLPRRADALFELCDALLCTDGPDTCLPEPTPARRAPARTRSDVWRPQPRPHRYRPAALVPGIAATAPRGFRRLPAGVVCPAGAPKPFRPGPGRLLGSKNHGPGTRREVGTIVKRPVVLPEHNKRNGW